MKSIYLITLITALSVTTAAFAAEDGEALFKNHKCIFCHSMTSKVLGPALQNIAIKYRGDNDAQQKLEIKVRTGGAGTWGKVPMPATAKSVSDADIKNMVQWVLSIK